MSDGWISGVPTTDGLYIVAAEETITNLCSFDVFSESPTKTRRWTTVAFWRGEWKSYNGSGYGFAPKVIRYMPLPAPPKEDA